MRIAELVPDHLDDARALLGRALVFDRIAEVAEEKLFGQNGPRIGFALGAFSGAALLGVAAGADRFVKLLAVEPDATQHGVGSALLEAVRARAGSGRRPLRIFDHPGNYLSPGLDARYAVGHAFLGRRGFRMTGEVENVRVPLVENPLVSAERCDKLRARVGELGYAIVRAEPDRSDALERWVASAFAPIWAFEVARALSGPRRAVHLALHDGKPVAFACADGNNRGLGWFGPAGTDPAHRGRGLGEALLIACLEDVRTLPEGGVIAWVGPKPFYARAAGAVDDRRFITYEEGP